MKLTSPAFTNNADIPAIYTCDGENKAPTLEIFGVPTDAKSLALVMDDPDATGGMWDHWILFNLPADITKIDETTTRTGGQNSWGKTGYGGPCPGTGKHRYMFKLYALDTGLDLPAGSDKKTLEQAMTGHILDQVTLTGLYQRLTSQ